jgi:hypothetical protein
MSMTVIMMMMRTFQGYSPRCLLEPPPEEMLGIEVEIEVVALLLARLARACSILWPRQQRQQEEGATGGRA